MQTSATISDTFDTTGGEEGPALPILISDGMGVESATILAKLDEDPGLLPGFSWDRTTVITAQTGGEYESTRKLRERYILPILRDRAVRTVQVARRGPKVEDGITVLDDTTEPYTVYIEGDFTLEQELRRSGVVPAFGGEHVCSMKSKIAPLETWRFNEFGEKPYVHIFGYNAAEQSRMEKARRYETEYCIPEYPLDVWGMDRGDCIDYLLGRFGVIWKKSACRFCVFCAVNGDALERWREEAKGAGESMFTEYLSLCMNPRSTLFRKGSMYSFVEQDGNEVALAHYHDLLDRSAYGLYEVRRIYSKKGKAMRAVEKLKEGPRAEMDRAWEAISRGLTLREEHGIGYAYVQEREDEAYPAFEHFFVVAPSLVETKTRYGFDNFNARWNELNLGGKFFPLTGEPQLGLFSAEAA